MNASRAKMANTAMKEIKGLGKSIGTPASILNTVASSKSGPTPVDNNGIPQPVQGMGLLQIFMYIMAGILLIGLLLLFVDYFITPIFQKSPGGAGYIPMPGNDTSDAFWKKMTDVHDITIGVPAAPANQNPNIPYVMPPHTQIIEQQTSYSITMDIYIDKEYSQDLGAATDAGVGRVFFALGPAGIYTYTGPTLTKPKLCCYLDNGANNVKIEINGPGATGPKTIIIENVPIHTPFRIGIIKTSSVLEGYLNGLLVKTIQVPNSYPYPDTGDMIYSPANIKFTPIPTAATAAAAATPVAETAITLSTGISVLNVHLFGNDIPAGEMKARMSDLSKPSDFGKAPAPVISTLPKAK